jgi:hypothetical protein
MSTYEEVGREEGLLEGDEPSRDAEGRCNDVDVEGLWTTVRAWRTRRLWGGHLARQVWRGDRGVYSAGDLGQGQTGREGTEYTSISGSVGPVTCLRRRRSGVSAGQMARQASVAAGVEVVGQAGSEQVDRAARSHNLLERHLDSIKERRLWRRLGLKVSTMERGRLSRDA